MFFSRALGVCVALGAASLALAQTPEQLAALEKDIEAARVRVGVPGASVAIIKDGKVVFAKGFGLRDLESQKPVTPDTLFAVGSSTKAFTAAAVLMAVDANKVRLDDPPRNYLPYFKMRDPDIDAKITVRDLLRHTSGLQRTDLMMMAADSKLNRQQMIQAACSAMPTAKLGEKWQYQNIMFSAAGEIASKSFGLPYEKVIQNRIFSPLGMKRVNLSVKKTLADADHATGYNLEASSKKTTPLSMRSIDSTAAAGAINASANEMVKWVQLWLDKGTVGNTRLLSEASYAEATKLQTESPMGGYGLGWFLTKWEGVPVVEHGGNIDGFNAEVGFIPSQKIGVVVLTNVSTSPLAGETAKLVWQHLGTKAPAVSEPVGVAENPQQEAGVYGRAESATIITVTEKDGGLTIQPTGQPAYPLIPQGGRSYKLGGGMPEGFLAIFKTTSGKNEVELKQPGTNATFTRGLEKAPPFVAEITVDELLKRMADASGGAEALRKVRTLKQAITVDYENQGMVGHGEALASAPYSYSEYQTLTAAGKKIGWLQNWFDGTQGGEAGSFIPTSPLEGDDLKREKRNGRFLDGVLDLQSDYEKLEIIAKRKAGDTKHNIPETDCWVLRMKAKGLSDSTTLYVSTDSYQLVREDITVANQGTLRSYFGDYKKVGPLTLSHLTVRYLPGTGAVVTRAEKVALDSPIAPRSFAGPGKK
ncbi:MAG: serine hydrolase domain-containing protein [Armatimonas sp.]